jgi:hypothetical protein
MRHFMAGFRQDRPAWDGPGRHDRRLGHPVLENPAIPTGYYDPFSQSIVNNVLMLI